ncbi:MAG: hypothetical protein AAF432_07455 [Planctomycetota bacterium]
MEQTNSTPVASEHLGIACVSCGYSLRGLDESDMCPECGTAVEKSLIGNLLKHADPSWVRVLYRGITLIAYGPLVMVGSLSLVILSVILSVIGNIAGVTGRNAFNMTERLSDVGMLGGMLMIAVGGILITAQDPRDRERESVWSVRTVARWGMIAAIVIGLADTFMADIYPAAPGWTMQCLTVLFAMALTVASVGVLLWIAKLARRVPNIEDAYKAEEAASFFRWALMVVALVTVAEALVAGVTGQLGRVLGILAQIAGCGSAIIFIGILGYMLSLAFLMFSLRSSIRDALAEAMDNR